MGRLVRENLPAALGALLGLAVMAWLGLVGFAWTDYDYEAAGAFDAIRHGDLSGFVAASDGYGGSFALRAPFAALPALWHGGELSVYRSVAVPCLLAAGVLGVWLVARMRAQGQGVLARAVVLALCVASPIAERALEVGHPEELLGAVLCVAAVLAAIGQRTGWAAVLLAVAIVNKPWALMAAGPVLVALEARGRRRLLVAGAAAAVLLAAPLVATHHVKAVVAPDTGPIFQPWQGWWWLGSTGGVVRGMDGQVKPGYRTPPAWLSNVTHPLIVVLIVPLTLAWMLRWRARRRGWGDELLLLAFLAQVRCLLDPWNTFYYALPALFALLAWEALARRRPPVVTLAATFTVWAVMERLPATGVSPDVQSAAYLAVAGLATIALGARTYGLRLPLLRARRGAAGPPAAATAT